MNDDWILYTNYSQTSSPLLYDIIDVLNNILPF